MSEKIELAQVAINSATILQAVKDIGRDCTRDEIAAILKIKEPYFLDMTKKLNNMKKSDLLHTPNVVRGGRYKMAQTTYNLTEHGKDHLERLNDRVQEYGEYDYSQVGRSRPPKGSKSKQQPALDLQPALTVSPAVQKAMDELAEVASDNEHCHKIVLTIKAELERFKLLNIEHRKGLTGAMGEIQRSTFTMTKFFEQIEKQIDEMIEG